jgi:hypothetical protein
MARGEKITVTQVILVCIMAGVLLGVVAYVAIPAWDTIKDRIWGDDEPDTTPDPTKSPKPDDYIPVEYQPRITFTYRGGTAANSETVYFYLPNADKTDWTQHGTSYTVSSGVVTGPPIAEGQIFMVHLAYSASTPVQEQYEEFNQPYAPDKWTQSFVNVGTFTVARAPSNNSMTHLYLYGANNTMISSTAGTASQISLAAASYPKANQPLKLAIVLDETWRSMGGAWSQPKTSLGTSAKDYVSVVKFSINATTGFTWSDDEWHLISGPSTTRNYTAIVPLIESGPQRELPKEHTMYLYIDWSGSAATTNYTLRINYQDTQVFSQVTAGSDTVRSAPNAGRLHTDSAVYYITIVA